ncbi:tryptophan 2,3-dioxygenase [Parendozoicomonas haliclonae]|uniref:Tryptophan 2,3-dioxygenase n=1 Tax=Parendozoicomonas haliclonae TaxID=1960125 RepID=A0A1X7AFR9_9GAMM|nr:tryptophan 2,3-dioxygenase family protein [Parendozoicomonas haliclonae]SMA38267.1 Tryptophan 2,3-dioxygenase [Parendozoicomonas haliclonae]
MSAERDGDKKQKNYADFLKLDVLLNLQETFQQPAAAGEMMFIMIHQISELWFKLLHHEIRETCELLEQSRCLPAVTQIERIHAILRSLISVWECMQTLTPTDFLAFRSAFGNSSGLQSYGYRLIEYALGDRDLSCLRRYEEMLQGYTLLTAELERPSLYDHVLLYLNKRGFLLPAELLERDYSQGYSGHSAVVDIWLTIYRNSDRYQDLFILGEKLIEIDCLLQQWRHRHAVTVERVIGMQPGSGGTSGVPYLKKIMEKQLFPDLYQLRFRLFQSL